MKSYTSGRLLPSEDTQLEPSTRLIRRGCAVSAVFASLRNQLLSSDISSKVVGFCDT